MAIKNKHIYKVMYSIIRINKKMILAHIQPILKCFWPKSKKFPVQLQEHNRTHMSASPSQNHMPGRQATSFSHSVVQYPVWLVQTCSSTQLLIGWQQISYSVPLKAPEGEGVLLSYLLFLDILMIPKGEMASYRIHLNHSFH